MNGESALQNEFARAPKLVGKTAVEAKQILRGMGIKPCAHLNNAQGHALVTEQCPEAGQLVPTGWLVHALAPRVHPGGGERPDGPHAVTDR